MHVYMVGPWMLCSKTGLNHADLCGWGMDALFSEKERKLGKSEHAHKESIYSKTSATPRESLSPAYKR